MRKDSTGRLADENDPRTDASIGTTEKPKGAATLMPIAWFLGGRESMSLELLLFHRFPFTLKIGHAKG